jgi:predicted dehydrogenase
MDESLLRTIHVGLGERGTAHLAAMLNTGLFEPVGLVDLDPRARERGRGIAGADEAACFEYLSDALAETDADAVIVAAPTRLHADFLMEAMAADRHVLVEPPLAVSLEEAHRCVFIAQNRGMKLMVAHAERYAPEYRTMRRVLDSGELGAPFIAKLVTLSAPEAQTHVTEAVFPWGYVLRDLDTLFSVVDLPFLKVRGRTLAIEGESLTDTLTGLAQGEGPVVLSYARPLRRPEGWRWFRVSCHEGSVRCRDGEVVLRHRGEEEAVPLPLEPPIEPSVEDLLARQFHAYVTEGVEPPTSGRRNLRVIELADAIRRSVETGREVTLGS